MSNPNGVVDIKTAAKTHQFKFGVNAICAVEEETGKSVIELFSQDDFLKNIGINDMRLFLWAGLRQFNPEITMDNAGDIIDEIGFSKALTVITDGVTNAFDIDPEPVNRKQRRAQKAKEGTGSKN